MVERVVKPKSKLFLWILSEISGRCFHRPIEINVSSRFLEQYGAYVQTGLSVFANMVPDSIPMLRGVLLGAVGELKLRSKKAVRVHNMVDKLELDLGSKTTSQNNTLPPAESFALLERLLKEHDDNFVLNSILTITNLECASLEDGRFIWAHPFKHAHHDHRVRVVRVSASMASDPTGSTAVANRVSISSSVLQQRNYYLTNFVIKNLSDDMD